MKFFLLSFATSYYHLFLFTVCWFFAFVFLVQCMRKILQPKKKVEMEEVGCNTLLYFCAPYNLPRKTLFRGNGSGTSNFGSTVERRSSLKYLQKFLLRKASNSQNQSQRRGQTPTHLHGKQSFLKLFFD